MLWVIFPLLLSLLQTYSVFSDGILEYTGLNRQFLFRRLAPSTAYTLMLEACTRAGCALSAPQPVRTNEAPPHAQLPPCVQAAGSTSVELTWSEPIHPNGRKTCSVKFKAVSLRRV